MHATSMRILMVPGFLAETWSPIEERYLWLDKPLNEIGACFWLVPTQGAASEAVTKEESTGPSSPVYVSKLREIGAHLIEADLSGYNLLGNFLKLAKLFREHRIDIVYTHFGALRFRVEAAARLCGVKVVRGEHNFAFHPNRRFRRLKRWFWRWSTTLYIPVSNAVAAHLSENSVMKDNYRVVHDGFDLDRFPAANKDMSRARICKELGIPHGTKLLVCVAKIHPDKQQHLLLEAMEAIPQDAVLLLVGAIADQGYADELVSRIERTGLTHRVRFLGYRNDTTALFDAAEISYLPSLVEGLGNVVIESGLMGTPVIATDLPAIREIIDHGQDGYLVGNADPLEIARLTFRLLCDDELRKGMGKSARAKMRRLFAKETFVRNTVSALVQCWRS